MQNKKESCRMAEAVLITASSMFANHTLACRRYFLWHYINIMCPYVGLVVCIDRRSTSLRRRRQKIYDILGTV